MPHAPAPDSPGKRYRRALLGVYVRASLWYLGLVAILWVLGFEAIHGHPTPFYALIAPAFGDYAETAWTLGSALTAATLLCLLLRGLYTFVGAAPRGRPDSTGDSGERKGGHGGPPRRDQSWISDELSAPLTRKQIALLVTFAALFPAAVAMMRGGPDGISQAYARQSYEYIGDIGKGGTIRGLFHDYEKIHPYLSMHAKVHPPGPIAILWSLSYVAGRTPFGLSIATILFGALSVVPMYFFAKDVLGARAGLIATLLYTLMPSIVLFTATSADITFMPFTLTTLLLFWRAIHLPIGPREDPNSSRHREETSHTRHGEEPSPTRHCEERGCEEAISSARRPRLARTLALPFAAGILYGLLGLISYSLVGVGAFFGLVGLWRLFDARYRWAVLRTALVMTLAALALHYLVYLWSGFNSVSVFQLARTQFNTDQANLDLRDPRWPAWAFKFVNPMSWFFFAGIPVSVLALRRMQSSFSRGRILFGVIGLTLLAFDILYLARGEGERSAMYVMPFIALPAAHMLDEICAAARSWRPLTVTLAFLGFQCIAIEAVLYTYW